MESATQYGLHLRVHVTWMGRGLKYKHVANEVCGNEALRKQHRRTNMRDHSYGTGQGKVPGNEAKENSAKELACRGAWD